MKCDGVDFSSQQVGQVVGEVRIEGEGSLDTFGVSGQSVGMYCESLRSAPGKWPRDEPTHA